MIKSGIIFTLEMSDYIMEVFVMANNTTKTNLFTSMAFKIMITIWGITLIASIPLIVFIVPSAQKALKETKKNYMLSEAVSQRKILDYELSDGEVDTDTYKSVLEGIKVDGMDSSYIYLVSEDGTMLYHPTADKIGQPVENSVVKDLVSKLGKGETIEDAVVEYDFRGTTKYAGYSITQDNKILVVSVDEAEILKPINAIRNKAIIVAVIVFILCGAYGIFIGTAIASPFKKLIGIINNTADFNFKKTAIGDKMNKRGDEAGAMSRAISHMRHNLRDVVRKIDDASSRINDNVETLRQASIEIDNMCSDNSTTTQQLAAGMQETSATTEDIYSNVEYMSTEAEGIIRLSVSGANLSNEVKERANNLRETTMAASTKTKDMYDAVKIKADLAIEGSKAVQKINELTDAIMSISSQTSLLALNASIEAARAGEAGRGFAVVASEIGTLAEQTSQAVGDINGIVSEVNEAVSNMSNCLSDTTDFLENTVMNDYTEFMTVGDQYNQDASTFMASMENIHNSIDNLTQSIGKVSQALSGITTTVGESTLGVTDVAEKTVDMTYRTKKTNDLVEESLECVKQLDSIVEQFILE